MAFAIWRGDQWEEIRGGFTSGEGADAVQHPPGWAESATEAERAAIGVAEILDEPPPVSELRKHKSVSSAIEDEAGAPRRVYTLVPYSSEEAAAIMWERAKAYRTERQCMPLPIADIVPGEVIIADCDQGSRDIVNELVQGATVAVMVQAPFELSFTAYDNRSFTVGAEQTIAIGTAITRHRALCHAASQGIRETINAAVANGATASAIFAIDIAAGYPPPQNV